MHLWGHIAWFISLMFRKNGTGFLLVFITAMPQIIESGQIQVMSSVSIPKHLTDSFCHSHFFKICCNLQHLKKMPQLMRRKRELPGINSAGCQTALSATQQFDQTLGTKAFLLDYMDFFTYNWTLISWKIVPWAMGVWLLRMYFRGLISDQSKKMSDLMLV